MSDPTRTRRGTPPLPEAAADGVRAAPPGMSGAAIGRLRLVIARLYRQMASGDDQNLTFAQLSALARIEEHGPVRAGELAAYEQVAAPSLTRTVGPLAAAGLIRKEADPSDGRSLLLSITPEGRDLLDRLRRKRTELLARRLTRLTPGQHDALLAALPALELLLTEAEPEPAPEVEPVPEPAPAPEPVPEAGPAARPLP